jgi:hypothetical protein
MDYDDYRERFFASPQPEMRFAFVGLHGLTLYFANYPRRLPTIRMSLVLPRTRKATIHAVGGSAIPG